MDYSPQNFLRITFPAFNVRHIFIAKLRLLVFLGFWVFTLIYFPSLLWFEQPIVLLVCLTFCITCLCYILIHRGVYPLFFFIIELVADVVAHTILIYISGGAYSNLYVVYLMYAIAAGIFFNIRVTVIVSILAITAYSSLLSLIYFDVLESFSFPAPRLWFMTSSEYAPFVNFTYLILFLIVTAYGLHIATHFIRLRELELEDRNKELVALNRISSTIRNVDNLNRVIQEVIDNIAGGFGYVSCLLLHVDELSGQLRYFVPQGDYAQEIKSRWNIDFNSIYLPLADHENFVYQEMKNQRPVMRFELHEVINGTTPAISKEVAEEIQNHFGFKKFIATPLVVDRRLVGALVGITRKEWIDQEEIDTFERFASQAAMTIDNAMLIEELKRKNIELERVSRIKSEFLATMSHELRTPLTAVIGFSELLMEEVMGDLNDEQKESMREVLNNAENLLQLINSLLDLAKIEAGKMDISIQPVNITDLFERIQRTTASLIHKKSHQLILEYPDDLPILYADERKIQQTLLNLISNAIKFTQQGGAITMSARFYQNPEDLEKYGKEVLNGLNRESYQKGFFEINVSDTGIGIKEGDLKYIFESFKQVDGSYTRNYEGTGLGLALTKRFIEMQQGRIWVTSEYQKGSTFCFILPRECTIGKEEDGEVET
jgi:signal transduction histidine kinase